MNNDRELLELAAKTIDGEVFYYGECFRLQSGYEWNPLLNDGDALRLAVALKLDIKNYDDYVHVWYQDFFSTGPEYFYGDSRKATRRAIVLAAAEIQRAKEAA